MKETIVKINKTKRCLFDKINKINKTRNEKRAYNSQCRNTKDFKRLL